MILKLCKRMLHQECGRKFVDTADLCSSDIHNILWTGLDLKAHAKNRRAIGRPLDGQRVTLLTGCGCSSLIVQAAMRKLGADLSIMLAEHWERSKFKRDVGRFYSLYSDLIIAQGRGHQSICDLTEGATVPVLNLRTYKYSPLQTLAVLMTLQERFGRLTGLTVAWVGPMGCHLNSLILILPKVGINLRFNSEPRPRFPASPIVLQQGKAYCQSYNTSIQACHDPSETISGVDVVATSKHRQDTIQIDMAMMGKAMPHWAFLHLLPRWQGDVTDEVFQHANSLVWTLHENIQYVTMAVVLHVLNKYNPVIERPRFG